MFLQLNNCPTRLIPKPLGKRVPVTFIGYAIINGSGFLLDISLLWLFNSIYLAGTTRYLSPWLRPGRTVLTNLEPLA